MAYLSLVRFRGLTTIPGSWVDEEETREPGWVSGQLEWWSRWLDARLAKRYATPFSEVVGETPSVVEGWLADIVTIRVLNKRGVTPQDEQYVELKAAAEAAKAAAREAADAKEGLYELPLRQTLPGANGVSRGAPLGYSEGSPYEWSSLQRDRARDEGVG